MAEAKSVIFVIDDDASVREAIEDLLHSVGHKVATYRSTQDFLNAPHPNLPACIVLDVRLPGSSGLELQRVLIEKSITFPIIFISAHADVPTSVRAMKMGAVEFLTKPLREQELLDAIASALDRDRLRRQQGEIVAELQKRFSSLTPREHEVFALVVRGYPNKRIAVELGMSEMTVKVHRSQITRKMQTKSIVDLVRMADRLGIGNEGRLS